MSTDAKPTGATGAGWERAAILAAFAYFAARLVYFAFAIDGSVPPDEETHVGRVLAYAKFWAWPTSGPDNYELGLLTHRPFLYSWAMGRLAAFASLGAGDLVWLRLVNVAMALGTVGYGLRFVRVVSNQPLTRVVFAVLITNTLMFTGIGSAVSYDNATNLLAAAAFYYLARIFADSRPRDVAVLLLVLGLGCLTKRSFLPLAALAVAAVLVHERHRLREWRAELGGVGRVLASAVLLVGLANAVLYGGNLVRFGRLVPGFEQVVGTEAARENRIFARDEILDGYREGRLTSREALARVEEIRHLADRESTRRQLAMLERRSGRDEWRISFPRYVALWGRIMVDRSMGYFGHRVIHRAAWEQTVVGLLLLLALALHAARWRQPAASTARAGGLLALGYALLVMLLVNLPTYLEKGIVDAGVQGRYLFPIWVPFLAWLAVAVCEEAPRVLRVPLAAGVCIAFLYSDLPTFLLRASPAWFAGGS